MACDVADVTMQRFDRWLTKIPEHTWGEDTTWYLSSYLGDRSYPLGDYMNWTNVQFERALNSPEYHMAIESWLDQRNYLSSAVEVLDRDQKYNALGSQMKDAIASIRPSVPNTTGYEKVDGTPIEQSANIYSCRGQKYRINMDMSLILDSANENKKEKLLHHQQPNIFWDCTHIKPSTQLIIQNLTKIMGWHIVLNNGRRWVP